MVKKSANQISGFSQSTLLMELARVEEDLKSKHKTGDISPQLVIFDAASSKLQTFRNEIKVEKEKSESSRPVSRGKEFALTTKSPMTPASNEQAVLSENSKDSIYKPLRLTNFQIQEMFHGQKLSPKNLGISE